MSHAPLCLRCVLLTAIPLAAAGAGCEMHIDVLEFADPSPCAEPNPVDTSRPTTLVGDGTKVSCTEEAFDAAMVQGGVVAFRCGTDPVTISLTTEKTILVDTVVDGGNNITLEGAGSSRLFVLGSADGRSASLTLQSLKIRGGHATASAATAGASPRAGGGAVLQFGGTLVITDTVLEDNDASDLGPDQAGGAVCSLGGRLFIARSALDGNRAGSGGAVAALGAELHLVRTQFTANQAVGAGSGVQDGIGGALLADQQGQSVAICQVTLSGNQAQTFGTAMHISGTGGESIDIEQSSVLDNTTPQSSGKSGGPAVYLGTVSARLSSVTVAGNQGTHMPGVWVNGEPDNPGARAATIQFTNVTIARNSVYRHSDPTADGVGAALWIEGLVHGELVNCTLASNVGEFGAGIVHPKQLIIRNSIVANQGTNVYNPQNCSDLGTPTVPASGDHVLQWPVESVDSYACAVGAFFADPLLGELKDNGGLVLTMMPSAASPAALAGLDCPSTDARGRPRPAGCTLGAVEADH